MTTLEKVQLLEQYLAASDGSNDKVFAATMDKLVERERNRLTGTKTQLLTRVKQLEEEFVR
jgi:hypothetical protein